MGRLRKIKNDVELVKSSNYYLKTNPISNNKLNYLEIGMGKGNFIINSAINNPEINFYGLDKFPTVILKAINKLNKLESKPKNLKFLAIDVKDIFEYFPKNFLQRKTHFLYYFYHNKFFFLKKIRNFLKFLPNASKF